MPKLKCSRLNGVAPRKDMKTNTKTNELETSNIVFHKLNFGYKVGKNNQIWNTIRIKNSSINITKTGIFFYSI